MNATDLKQIKNIILDSLKGFRNDLKKDFATKDDLKQFATKDDLKTIRINIDKLKKNSSQYATKTDIKKLATKKDLKLGLDNLLMQVVSLVDKHKVEKTHFKVLEKRVDKIEQHLTITTP